MPVGFFLEFDQNEKQFREAESLNVMAQGTTGT